MAKRPEPVDEEGGWKRTGPKTRVRAVEGGVRTPPEPTDTGAAPAGVTPAQVRGVAQVLRPGGRAAAIDAEVDKADPAGNTGRTSAAESLEEDDGTPRFQGKGRYR